MVMVNIKIHTLKTRRTLHGTDHYISLLKALNKCDYCHSSVSSVF